MSKTRVVIETPRGSNAKYAYDPARRAFVLAIRRVSRAFAKLRELEELPVRLIEEVENFFVHYHGVRGGTFKPLARLPAREAVKLIEKFRRE